MINKNQGEHRNGLRNCPFCGKHGTVAVILEAYGSTIIRCDPDRGTGGCGASTAPFPTKAKAADAWNRRTSYIGKGDFEKLAWPYNLVAELFGTDDELNGVELTEDQVKGIEYALETLTDRERGCTLRYYRDGALLDGIAKEYGLTRERIRQVIVKAIRKLRNPVLAKYIKQGYAIASGEVAQQARAAYQSEIDLVKGKMLAEARAEVLKKVKVEAEQAGVTIPESCRENITLVEMDLSVRSYNCLRRALGYLQEVTAADVLAVAEPGKIWNLGKRSGEEIACKLTELGFDISGTGWERYMLSHRRRKCDGEIDNQAES